jgi:hypothetical protein
MIRSFLGEEIENGRDQLAGAKIKSFAGLTMKRSSHEESWCFLDYSPKRSAAPNQARPQMKVKRCHRLLFARIFSFSSSNRQIRWHRDTNFSASCSTAACSQSRNHSSFSLLLLLLPTVIALFSPLKIRELPKLIG